MGSLVDLTEQIRGCMVLCVNRSVSMWKWRLLFEKREQQ